MLSRPRMNGGAAEILGLPISTLHNRAMKSLIEIVGRDLQQRLANLFYLDATAFDRSQILIGPG
ncbi:MAG TPA: hypothetical protein VLB68_23525 [Pyrinomonadaceae bacterium]|nr:hypothetical protein [Pyrinomonadaceae bacterium]